MAVKSQTDKGALNAQKLEQKHRSVIAVLKAGGFSTERAEELWQGLDQTQSIDEVVAAAIFQAGRENTDAADGKTGPRREPPPDIPSQADDVHSTAGPNGESPSDRPPQAGQVKGGVPVDDGPIPLFEGDPFAAPEEVGGDVSEEEEEEKEVSIETAKCNQQFLDALPPLMRELCTEIMRFLGIPALLPTVCILLAVSAALLRGLCCRSNKGITYANLFALLGADSGSGKSLTYNAAMAPLEELDAALLEAFEDAKDDAQAQLGMVKDDITALRFNYTKARKAEEALTKEQAQAFKDKIKALQKQQRELETLLTQEPSLWCADFTAEALGVLLANNREQMSVCCDEGSITLDNMMGRYTKGDSTDDGLMRKGYTVNSHKIHRIGRPSISLKKPCLSLLLLVQENILSEAFANTRFVMGGFLARCLTAHCRLKMLAETEESIIPLSEELIGRWRDFIHALYLKFRCSNISIELKVDPEVRVLARQQHIAIAQAANGKFRDIRSFAARWVEQTWKLAEVIHAGLYGPECDGYILSPDTFKNAQVISRLFCQEQLKVLGVLRSEQLRKNHHRLQELFLANDNEPMRLRNLERIHGLARGDVKDCVSMYPKIYGLIRVKPARGSRSTLVFLQEHPPQ